MSLFLAEGLALGPRELTDTEQDFTLAWWPLAEAAAAGDERFLLPAGPLALLLAERVVAARP